MRTETKRKDWRSMGEKKRGGEMGSTFNKTLRNQAKRKGARLTLRSSSTDLVSKQLCLSSVREGNPPLYSPLFCLLPGGLQNQAAPGALCFTDTSVPAAARSHRAYAAYDRRAGLCFSTRAPKVSRLVCSAEGAGPWSQLLCLWQMIFSCKKTKPDYLMDCIIFPGGLELQLQSKKFYA